MEGVLEYWSNTGDRPASGESSCTETPLAHSPAQHRNVHFVFKAMKNVSAMCAVFCMQCVNYTVSAVCDLLIEPVRPLPGGGLAVNPHAVLRAAGQGRIVKAG